MFRLTMLLVATMSMVTFAQGKQVEPKTEFIFQDGDVIDGNLSAPDVEYFTPGSPAVHPKLIKVREDFKEKVMQSAGEL